MFYKAIALSLLMLSNIVQANCPELDFEVNPLTLKPHTFKDSCLATYTGTLNVPCVEVGTTSYNVDFIQRPDSLIFGVSNVR